MKRDIDLIRQILILCEAQESHDFELEVEGYSDAQISHHVHVMIQAGLLDGTESVTDGKIAARATGISWLGHEFLDAGRDDVVWNRAKREACGLGFETIKNALNTISAEIVKHNMKLT